MCVILIFNDLQQYVEEDIASSIMSMTMDYGPIVGSIRLKQAILSLYQTGSLIMLPLLMGRLMQMNW